MPDEHREKAVKEIRRLVKEFDDHPWDINNGRCDDFADKLVEALGDDATSHWVVDLPDYHLPRDDHDICHAVVVWKGWYFDAEEPCGVLDWRHLPLCARVLRTLEDLAVTARKE